MLLLRLVSQPSSGTSLLLSLQLPYPESQVGAQDAPEQEVADAWLVLQVRPHFPQLAASLTFTCCSQSLVMTLSQLPQPELQLIEQDPELQLGLEFG